MSRDPLLAKIHIAKKQLGLDDAAYRAVLHGVTGKTSSADMTQSEREAVLDRFSVMGLQPSVPKKGKFPASKDKAKKTTADKIRAMWLDMHQLGIVKKGTKQGLSSYLWPRYEIMHPEWLNAAQSIQAIEALKKWCERATGYADPRDIPADLRQEIINRNNG